MTEPIGGAIVPQRPADDVPVPTRPTVDVTGATAGLAVGPSDVLVLTFPAALYDDADLQAIKSRMLDVLPADRFLLVFADGVQMSKVDVPGRGIEPGPAVCDACGSSSAVQTILGVPVCLRCQRWNDGTTWHERDPEPREETPAEPREREPGAAWAKKDDDSGRP